jgi:hypothetical protein
LTRVPGDAWAESLEESDAKEEADAIAVEFTGDQGTFVVEAFLAVS